MADPKPPYRAEHVGSFPRPDRLLKARQDYSVGKIPKEDLKRTEAECIREIVHLQERVGVGAITDGEYPKTGWRDFLFEKCDGFDSKPTVPDFKFRLYDGTQWDYPGEPRVIGKVRRREPLSADDFSILKGLTRRPTKANLPTPSIAHLSGDRLLDRSVYPDRKIFFADLARVMREEIADLVQRGCNYLQMDEVPIAVLCDPQNREIVTRRGEDPEELIDNYIDAINEFDKRTTGKHDGVRASMPRKPRPWHGGRRLRACSRKVVQQAQRRRVLSRIRHPASRRLHAAELCA